MAARIGSIGRSNEDALVNLTPINASHAFPFDARLEVMRGVASLSVCVFHALHVFSSSPRPAVVDELLFFAFNPTAAVMFFFVLSGYVLGGSLERNPAIVPYLARRLFRVVPPFVAAVLFAFACERLLRIEPAPFGFTAGFERLFWPQPGWDDLWNNLLLGSNRVIGPTWTLYPELLGSLMLPLVVAAHGLVKSRWRWALFVAITALLAIGPFKTLLWFYFGYFLAKEFAAALVGRERLALISFVAGLIGLEVAGTYSQFYALSVIIPSAIAASLMMGAVVSSRHLLRGATIAPLRFLGRISFSLYLLHWPILYVCGLAVAGCNSAVSMQSWGTVLVAVASLTAAIVVAAMSYRFIEAPSIEAGKRVARLLSTMSKRDVAAPAVRMRATASL